MFELVLANYYISVISARWLRIETRLPVSFKHLVLPPHFLDLQALPLSALHNRKFEARYSSTIQTFNKTQPQGFQTLYTPEDVFIGTPTGGGKTTCAEFASLRLWNKRKQPRAVCMTHTRKRWINVRWSGTESSAMCRVAMKLSVSR
jgi:pre-mRNA-splicing helicase BRR2